MPKGLLPRQIRFAAHCLTEPSAARAAVRAGYAPASARNQAYRLLKNDDIRRRIEGGLATLRARDRAERDRLIAHCERIFLTALGAGRLEAALGALKAETDLAGLLPRTQPRTPAQRIIETARDGATADGDADGVGPGPPGKL